MKAIFSSLLFLLFLTLTACTDVTPQVSQLRSLPKPVLPFAPDKNLPAETDITTVTTSSSNDGYKLSATVSKQDTHSGQVSADGYILIQNQDLE